MSTQSFGEYLRQLRKAKGIGSSHKMSKASGVSQSFIAHIELGKKMPSPDVVRKFAETLGVTHIGLMIKAGHVTEEEVLTFRQENGINDLREEN